VAREGTKEEDMTKGECDPESDNHCSSSRQRFVEPPDKLPMTAMACDKIHIFAEGEVIFKSLIFDPDSQPPKQFNKHGLAAEIIKLHIRRIFITDDFTDMMPSYRNFVESVTESDDPPLNVSRSMGDQGRQLEALTEGEDSDNRQHEGAHDDHHQKVTQPNREFTSPVNATYKSIAAGEQNHGVKACLIKMAVEEAIMFDEAHKGDVSKQYNEADNVNMSSKSAKEVTVMMYNTATLKSTYSLKATVNIEDKNEVPQEDHDDHDQAKQFKDMKEI
jgi:hypothetical protein